MISMPESPCFFHFSHNNTDAKTACYAAEQEPEPAAPKRPVIIFEEGGSWEALPQKPKGTQTAVNDGSDGASAAKEGASSTGSSGFLATSDRSIPGAPHHAPVPGAPVDVMSRGLASLGSLSAPPPEEAPQLSAAHGGVPMGQSSGRTVRGEAGRGLQRAAVPAGYQECVRTGGLELWRRMLHVAATDPDIKADAYKKDSEAHRLKVGVLPVCPLCSGHFH